jgi:hypothetical protein
MRKVVNVEEGPEVGLSPHINSFPPFLLHLPPPFSLSLFPLAPYSPFLPIPLLCLPSLSSTAFLCILCLPLLAFTFLCLLQPFASLFYLSSPSSAFLTFLCLPHPSAAFRCLPLPTAAFICIPLPSSACLCLPLPLIVFYCLYCLPLSSFTFLSFPLPFMVFLYLPFPYFTFLSLALPSSALLSFDFFPSLPFFPLSLSCIPPIFASLLPFLFVALPSLSFFLFLSFLSPSICLFTPIGPPPLNQTRNQSKKGELILYTHVDVADIVDFDFPSCHLQVAEHQGKEVPNFQQLAQTQPVYVLYCVSIIATTMFLLC